MSSKVSKLLGFLILVTGVVSYRSGNNEIASYYSDNVHNSYNSVFVERWNKVVKASQNEATTRAELINEIHNSFAIGVTEALAGAKDKYVPEGAKSFHVEWIATMENLKVLLPSVVEAINAGSEDQMVRKFKLMSDSVQKIEKLVMSFRQRMKDEFGIKFQPDKPVQ